MPKKISAWQCEFCSRYRKTKSAITKHEQICFENPNRRILEGQLAIFRTLPNALKRVDSYGVAGSEWVEPIWSPPKELREKYKWWPFGEDSELQLGCIYENGKWVPIEGYEPPEFAPGFSWKDEIIPADDPVDQDCRWAGL